MAEPFKYKKNQLKSDAFDLNKIEYGSDSLDRRMFKNIPLAPLIPLC